MKHMESIPCHDNESPILVNLALVFIVNCTSQTWKITVSYFFIDGSTDAEIASSFNQWLVALHHSSIKIVFSEGKYCMRNEQLSSVVLTTGNERRNLYIPRSFCHKLKLLRNTLGSADGNGKLIAWDLSKLLHNLQKIEGMHLGNRLCSVHKRKK